MATKRLCADRRPTWTSLILDALIRADDFMTMPQLGAVTGATSNQLTASLFHLRKRRAVECVASDGQLFWFATPADDTRTKIVQERVPEPKGNRCRRSAACKNLLCSTANGV